MYDKYDSPGNDTQSTEGYEGEEGSQVSDIAEQLKANAPKIAAVLVLLVVAFFAYDYFVGSIKQVSVNIVDTEGNEIEGATVKISSGSGQEIARAVSAESISIRAGSYKLDASASGYKPVRGKTIKIDDSGPIEQTLEADKSVELVGNWPESFATGQEQELIITANNKAAKPVEIDFVATGDAKSGMTIEYAKPLVISPGSNEIPVTIKVAKTASIGEKNGGIRIEGLSAKSAQLTGDYTVEKYDDTKFKATIEGAAGNFTYSKRKPAETINKVIKLENNNSFAITSVQSALEITSTEFTDPLEAAKWFKISPSSLFDVDAKSSQQGTLTLTIPAGIAFPSGKETESIVGNIKFTNTFVNKKIDFTLTLQKIDAGITLLGINDTYNIVKVGGVYAPNAKLLTIKNKGSVDLTGLEVKVQCNSTGTSWITIEGGQLSYAFDVLAKGASKDVEYTIYVPPATPMAQSASCRIGVFYDDPSGIRKSEEQTVLLTTI